MGTPRRGARAGTASAKKAAAVTDVLRDAISELSKVPGPRALRDRALLLVGFAGALRRSEVVALDVADLRFVPEGLVRACQLRSPFRLPHAMVWRHRARVWDGQMESGAG